MVYDNEEICRSLPSNWLEYDVRLTTAPQQESITVAPLTIGNNTTWYQPYEYKWYWNSYPSKLRLKLSEVEKLRAAARKDKALKAILQKFTPHIEIEVDFE